MHEIMSTIHIFMYIFELEFYLSIYIARSHDVIHGEFIFWEFIMGNLFKMIKILDFRRRLMAIFLLNCIHTVDAINQVLELVYLNSVQPI